MRNYLNLLLLVFIPCIKWDSVTHSYCFNYRKMHFLAFASISWTSRTVVLALQPFHATRPQRTPFDVSSLVRTTKLKTARLILKPGSVISPSSFYKGNSTHQVAPVPYPVERMFSHIHTFLYHF